MQPIVHIFKAANIAEQMLREGITTRYAEELRTKGWPDINLTSLLVLHALAVHSRNQDVRRGRPQSAAEIAEQLGCPRPRVSMELRRLLARRWVDAAGISRTSRVYVLTPRGLLAARAARDLMVEQSHAMHQVNRKRMTLVRTLEWVIAAWAGPPGTDGQRKRGL